MMKKITVFILILLTVIVVPGITGFAADLDVVINGKECGFEPAPVLKDATIMIPMRATFEAMGAEVLWDEENRTAVGVLGDKIVKATLGDKLDVDPYQLDPGSAVISKVKVIEGNIFIPLRNAFEAMGSTVTWEPENRRAVVTFEEELPEEKLEQLVEAVAQVPESYNESNDVGYNTVFHQKGIASWYGSKFQGNNTASGEVYNMHDYTAAHRDLDFGTLVKVTHLKNGDSVIVRINDRGPHVQGRIIDLSYAAAHAIGISGLGTVKVEIIKD